MKVLICDPINREAIEFLKRNGIEAVFKPEISFSDLKGEVKQFDAILVRSRTKVTKEIIANGKNLKVVGRVGSGYDNIDIQACRESKITVINAPEANSQAVAEMTVGFIISLIRKMEPAFSSMRSGGWIKNSIWGRELNGLTVGIIGYGYVGKRVVELLKAFGCRILIFSKKFRTSTLEEIFTNSDIVSLHLALNSQTSGFIDKRLLVKMKKDSYLINIARGKVINEDDLYEILQQRRIAGAALDVFWEEPLPAGSRWRKLENVILTPHIGAATNEALKRAGLTVAEDIVRINRGENPKYEVKLDIFL